jgi:cellulose synthase/poly-beta-1,6-N-acetylglucosamine synthase-like glycosyltransferase
VSAQLEPPSGEELDPLEESIWGLRRNHPSVSAARTTERRQQIGIVTVLVLVATSVALWPVPTCTILVGAATVVYLGTLIDRTWLFARGVEASPEIKITDHEALLLEEDDLPVYTVLLPAYQEPEIAARLIANLGRMNYPADRLDIKLLLEADDAETVAVAQAALTAGALPAEIILVPPAEPRTKPKACNFGLYFARGELLTIYDAEDIPDPLQLRRAVVGFSRVGPEVACLQAKLKYHNARQNLLTRWFSAEYNQWFGYTLPGLMRAGAPIPLGGTSNHMRTATLIDVGGWDPFNVTEDADLGIRLHRQGYRTAMLDSVTYEEANSDVLNWVRQRSRWYKGYLQTFLVHARNPRTLVAELGWRGTLRFLSVTAGTPLQAAMNLAFWGLTFVWLIGHPNFIHAIYPILIFYPAMFCLVIGNAIVIYCGVFACRQDRTPSLLLACFLVPAYWVLMSIAGLKGLFQLIFQPSYWEKTAHGLDHP